MASSSWGTPSGFFSNPAHPTPLSRESFNKFWRLGARSYGSNGCLQSPGGFSMASAASTHRSGARRWAGRTGWTAPRNHPCSQGWRPMPTDAGLPICLDCIGGSTARRSDRIMGRFCMATKPDGMGHNSEFSIANLSSLADRGARKAFVPCTTRQRSQPSSGSRSAWRTAV